MSTITIDKKEYESLVFSKGISSKNRTVKKKSFVEAGFGSMKKNFAKGTTLSIVKNLRSSWR